MYKTIKKFLAEGGKCLLIENGEPVGVVLTIEEYEKIKPETRNPKLETNSPPQTPPYQGGDQGEVEASPPKANQSWAGAEIADIEAVDDVTLKDLGIDELPY